VTRWYWPGLAGVFLLCTGGGLWAARGVWAYAGVLWGLAVLTAALAAFPRRGRR
jgi:hypothetical protein